MQERPRGLRRVLELAPVYRVFQSVLSPRESRRLFVDRHIRARPGDRVIDIGCGPGRLLDELGDVEYLGIDPSPRYIAAARRTYGHRARFVAAAVEEVDPAALGEFDVAVAKGVLHHLDDDQAFALLELARRVLSDHGRLATMDPCFSGRQSRIARELARRDRGGHVRELDGYRTLAKAVFSGVDAVEYDNLLRVPYHHALLECRR